MPGVWLGENSIPKLLEVTPGTFRFSHSTERNLWPGILVVAVIGLPCAVLCLFLACYGDSATRPVFLWCVLGLFASIVIGAFVWGCWGATSTVFETVPPAVRREYFLLGRKFWLRRYEVEGEDFFVIKADSDDEHGTGGYHRIYLCRGRPFRMISAIHLPSIAPSAELLETSERISTLLGIESRGYVKVKGLVGLWVRYLFGKA
ncbi:MAG: hypothetical protein AAGG48_28570 [Planctomycetota bacterium]